MKGPLPIRSKRDALNWMRALDLYELATLPPDVCLEVAHQLTHVLRKFRLPVRRDYALWLENYTSAMDIARDKYFDIPILPIPTPKE